MLVTARSALEDEFDIVMPDARGHGGSTAPDVGYSYDQLTGEDRGAPSTTS
ncbi:MAG: hypothetical protein JWN39_4386, partial [Ilumatobacteraceae bacterium]|nr:hypothetical protein [Ilumatobacteraceae bacterium]